MNNKKFLKVTHIFNQENRNYIKIVLNDFNSTGAKITLDKLGLRILVSRGNITKVKKTLSKHSRKIQNIGILIRVYDKESFENQFKQPIRNK